MYKVYRFPYPDKLTWRNESTEEIQEWLNSLPGVLVTVYHRMGSGLEAVTIEEYQPEKNQRRGI